MQQQTTVIVNDGRELSLAWLEPDDLPLFQDFAHQLDRSDIARLTQDLNDPQALPDLMDLVKRGNMAILAALDPEAGGRMVGYCYLHLGHQAHAHKARVEVCLHPDYRQLGLGSNLLREVAAHSQGRDLLLLECEAAADDRELIQALKTLGFEIKAIIEEYRIDHQGEPYDVIILLRRLRIASVKDFLYRF